MNTALLLIGFVLASIHFAEAQQPAKLYWVGFAGQVHLLFTGRDRHTILTVRSK
jgi:hypothetical protein